MTSENLRKNVSVIVFKNNRFLILHKFGRTVDNLKFPQTAVYDGEKEEDAVKRVLADETGIEEKDLKIIGKSGFIHTYHWPQFYAKEKGYDGQIQSFYLCEFKGDEEDLEIDTNEYDEYKWVTKDELFEYLKYKDLRDTIKKILNEEFKGTV